MINILKKTEGKKTEEAHRMSVMCVWSCVFSHVCLVRDSVQTYLIFLQISLFLLFMDQNICNAMQNHLKKLVDHHNFYEIC